MRTLTVYIQIRGKDLLCGEIRGMSWEDACFSYVPSFLEREDAAAVSLSFPLKEGPFGPERTRAFFSLLLPSGRIRRELAGLIRCREDDYLSMLSILGSDCRGGLKVLEEEYPLPESCCEAFDDRDMNRLSGGTVRDMASLLIRSSTAVPGEAPACCLKRKDNGGRWLLPMGGLTGTHLVLQSRPLYERGLLNAALCMGAARKLGISTSDADLTGQGGDHRILLAVERSDREKAGDGDRIIKRHQEDMGQALGILPEKTYEKEYEGYMPAMFSLLRERARRPVPDMLSLWDRIIFDFLIGNLEGSVRSFAVSYGPALSSLSLAPAQYISCTAMYEPVSGKLPFSIDGCYSPDSLSGRSFEKMAPECGLGRKMGRKRFDLLAGGLEKALYESAEDLKKQGFEDAPALAGQILEAGGIRNLL